MTVEAEQDLLSVEDQMRFHVALLHTSLSSQHDRTLAALAFTTSQAPTQQKQPEAPKETRAEKVFRLKASLGSGSIAARLAQLLPEEGKKEAANT